MIFFFDQFIVLLIVRSFCFSTLRSLFNHHQKLISLDYHSLLPKLVSSSYLSFLYTMILFAIWTIKALLDPFLAPSVSYNEIWREPPFSQILRPHSPKFLSSLLPTLSSILIFSMRSSAPLFLNNEDLTKIDKKNICPIKRPLSHFFVHSSSHDYSPSAAPNFGIPTNFLF